jgi:zinc finger SWIM domain-containing protein 3
MSCIRRNEIELDAKAMVSILSVKISIDGLKKTVAQILTPEIVKKVSFQIKKACN